jgi:hypothetical protein
VPLVVIVGKEVSASTIIAVAGERFVSEPAAFVATVSRRRYLPTTELSGEYVNEVAPSMSSQVFEFVAEVHIFH